MSMLFNIAWKWLKTWAHLDGGVRCRESLAQCDQRVVPHWFVNLCVCSLSPTTILLTAIEYRLMMPFCLSFLPPETCHVLFVLLQELHEWFPSNGRLCSIQPWNDRLCLYLPQRPQAGHCSTQEACLVSPLWLRRNWFEGHFYSHSQTLRSS